MSGIHLFVVCVSGVRDRGSRRCVGVRPVPLIIPRLPRVSARRAAPDRIDALKQMRVFALSARVQMTELIAVLVSINAALITFNAYMCHCILFESEKRVAE
jgi:hypothetical protein